MTTKQIDEAFGGMSRTHPFWLALSEILNQNVDERVESASGKGSDQHESGALCDALEIRAAIFDRMERIKPSGSESD